MQTAQFIRMISEGGAYNAAKDQEEVRRRLEQFADIFMDPEAAQMAVAVMDEAMINPRVYDLTVDATRRVRDFIAKTHFEANAEQRSLVSPELFAARTVSFRAMMEGLRFAILFNPTVDRDLLKKVTVDRMLMILKAECEADTKLTDSVTN